MKIIEFSKKHAPGYVLVALLSLFVCSFAIQQSNLGATLASAFIPVEAEDRPSFAPRNDETIGANEVRSAQPTYAELVRTIRDYPQRIPALPTSEIDLETLWLARCIFSETKRPEEMELVAWVIRNRVETSYRGRNSYRDVVLDPFQFSAFNPNNPKRWFYSSLDTRTSVRNWQKALTIAHSVRRAEPEFRPFSVQTRHFFSERSMLNEIHPEWARGQNPVAPSRPFRVDERRFRFYEGIS